MKTLQYYTRGLRKTAVFLPFCLFTFLLLTASCSDFFDQDSDHVVFTDDKHLNEPGDTIYSMIGILQKLQALGDRTVLLGEARGDLVSVTDAAGSDLRDVANFNIGDDNQYNSPRDYYAVINNCNFYIAKCDTSLKDSRNNYIFMREYAAVKAIRAWTYLQLAINYGRVPFVTEPILTKEQADATYPTQDIQGICEYFIKDIEPLATVERPGLLMITNSYNSRFLYFPIYIVLGDLNLWAGNYAQAALAYYHYIATANGTNSYYPGSTFVHWANANWSGRVYRTSGSEMIGEVNETYSTNGQLITMIPGDSLTTEGNYSQLRYIFNARDVDDDNYHDVWLVPSTAMQNLSAAQSNNFITEDKDVIYTPAGLSDNRSGDLRLSTVWSHMDNYRVGDRRVYNQSISKYQTRNIHIYRRTMVYLRLAEALNRAGYPHFAYQILARGVNNNVIAEYVLPYCTTASDSAFVNQFSFPGTASSGYIVYDINNTNTQYNTIGIHSRGAGWACYDENYQMPNDTTLTGTELKNYQIEKVEDMIVDENALECAFEGTRYYDLLRVGLRRNDPSYIANKVKARNGDGNDSGITKALSDWKDFFLSWQGKIGY